MIKNRIGGLECENQRPEGTALDVGVQESSIVWGVEAMVCQILRRSSGGRRGKEVNLDIDFGNGRPLAGREQC